MYAFNKGFEDGYRLALETDDYNVFLDRRYRLEREIDELRRQAREGPAEELWNRVAEAEEKGYYLFGLIEGYHDALSRKERELDEQY